MTNTARSDASHRTRRRLLGVVASILATSSLGVAALSAMPADAAPKATTSTSTSTKPSKTTPTTTATPTTVTPTTVTPTTVLDTTTSTGTSTTSTSTGSTTTSTGSTGATTADTTSSGTDAVATTTPTEPVGTATPIATAPASAPAPSGMLVGTRNAGAGEPYTVAGMNAWQGKTNAVVQTYVRSTWTPEYVVSIMDGIWKGGSVPSVSYDLQVTNPQVLSGTIDPNLNALASAFKTWLAGPDGTYGNGDDRRAYFRPAWEGNGNWYRWSPCYYAGGTGTIADYKAMWRYLYAKFGATGIERTRLAWIYSVNSGDKVSTCSAELLYPGDAYVDWTGIDGYTGTSTASALDVFNPMVVRLRALAPTKPVSINEWGSDTVTSVGKSAWIDAQFAAAHKLGIKMNVVFNIDKERDWAVYGGTGGDETVVWAGQTLKAWSAYRRNVADSRVLGADATNARLLSDGQFLGQ